MDQEIKNGNFFSNILTWTKSHFKIIGIVVVILILVIVLMSIFTSGPKKAIKSYIKAMNSCNVEKFIKTIDFAGQEAWSYSFYDIDDFDNDDYDDFIEEYKDVDQDEIDDSIEYMEDSMKEAFDEMEDDYTKYKVSLEKFKGVKELGKDLYLVKAKISLRAVPEDKEDDEIDSADIYEFIVYKNKIIDSQM